MRRFGCTLTTLCFALGAGCVSVPSFETYHKAAVRQRALKRAPKSRATHPRPTAPRYSGGWPYPFTRSQLRRLKGAGCRFDAADLARARELQRRGFTVAEYVQAYEDVMRYGGRDRAELGAIAAYRVAGFDMKRYAGNPHRKVGLTAHYNHHFVGGSSTRAVGFALSAIGLVVTAVGAGFLISEDIRYRECLRHDDEMRECGGPLYGLGKILFGSIIGLGSALSLAGGITLLVSYENPYRQLRKPVLDKADAETLRDFRRWRRLVDSKRNGTSLSLAPSFNKSGGGLVLKLRW